MSTPVDYLTPFFQMNILLVGNISIGGPLFGTA